MIGLRLHDAFTSSRRISQGSSELYIDPSSVTGIQFDIVDSSGSFGGAYVHIQTTGEEYVAYLSARIVEGLHPQAAVNLENAHSVIRGIIRSWHADFNGLPLP